MVNLKPLEGRHWVIAALLICCTPSARSAGRDFLGDSPRTATHVQVAPRNNLQVVQNRNTLSASPSRPGWQMVRTPGPEKAGDTVSMMRTGDLLNSDPDFAGMMIRCQEKGGPQIAFVLVTPFKPRSKAKVTVRTGQAPVNFDGAVIGPGSMIALPAEASPLLRTWQTARSVNVEIEGETATVKGVVALDGLTEAVTQLETSCMR